MKTRGRPRIDATGRSTSIHLRLSAKAYDRMFTQARQQHRSIPEVIRTLIDTNKAVPKIDQAG